MKRWQDPKPALKSEFEMDRTTYKKQEGSSTRSCEARVEAKKAAMEEEDDEESEDSEEEELGPRARRLLSWGVGEREKFKDDGVYDWTKVPARQKNRASTVSSAGTDVNAKAGGGEDGDERGRRRALHKGMHQNLRGPPSVGRASASAREERAPRTSRLAASSWTSADQRRTAGSRRRPRSP